MTWKLFKRCEMNTCRKWNLIIRKCTVKLPTGHTAMLKDKLMCGTCIKNTRKALEK